ncbi:hypothetical protein [Natrinema sp. DC36]|uniref:hypothetical protein n=1 Tax=Natrinema sp. DC36 TaxID=2878680 RepID=UPI001CF0676B|nr:hypothetical protein [Natrinema sp. DC36]
MSEIKTPNFRLTTCMPVSTGHHYCFKDRRTDMVVYFDEVKVYDGVVDQIKFYDSNGDRAGHIDDIDPLPQIVIDTLEHIEEHDEFLKTASIVPSNIIIPDAEYSI